LKNAAAREMLAVPWFSDARILRSAFAARGRRDSGPRRKDIGGTDHGLLILEDWNFAT
jgi:hypothetical protein